MIKIELSQQDVKQNDPVYFLLKNISLFLLKAGSQKCQNNALYQRLKPREFIELWRGTVQMPSFMEASVQGHSKIFKFWEKIYWHFVVLIFLLKLLQQFSFYRSFILFLAFSLFDSLWIWKSYVRAETQVQGVLKTVYRCVGIMQ